MINQILQFIKKAEFAAKLAKYDLLFLLKKQKIFKGCVLPAAMFERKSNLPPLDRIRLFLSQENNAVLDLAATEISTSPAILKEYLLTLKVNHQTFSKGDKKFLSALNLTEQDSFYLDLLKEYLKGKGQSKKQKKYYKKQLDSLMDMRLYASELEFLNQNISGSKKNCPFEIDWIRTEKKDLYLIFKKECFYTSELNISAQKNLAEVFGYMLFENSVFVSFWKGLLTDSEGKVSFLDFDNIYEADSDLKKFAANYIQNGILPKKDLEYKMQRALNLLSFYCKDINPFDSWQKYIKNASDIMLLPTKTEGQEKLLKDLSQNGVVIQKKESIELPKAKDLSYLLDSSRHKKDPRFRKSQAIYWGPLLILIYILLKYF